jgi:hypothetical protein
LVRFHLRACIVEFIGTEFITAGEDQYDVWVWKNLPSLKAEVEKRWEYVKDDMLERLTRRVQFTNL